MTSEDPERGKRNVMSSFCAKNTLYYSTKGVYFFSLPKRRTLRHYSAAVLETSNKKKESEKAKKMPLKLFVQHFFSCNKEKESKKAKKWYFVTKILAAKYKRNFDSFCTFMAESIICQLAVSDSSQKISVNFLATFKAFSQFTNPNTQA